MTITTIDTVERYVGDGSQSAWPIRFPFFKGEDIKACIVNNAGEQVNLAYGSDYTVTKSDSSIGGTLNYTLTDGIELTIWLSLPLTQTTDFYNTGPLNAEVLESTFDRLTLIAQQLQEASDRSVKVATSSTETPEQLLTTLYSGRDSAIASAAAAASSENNAATSEQAAATSKNNAASSENAAAASALTAEAWAESDTPPDPNNTESKSAKAWALSAAANVPIATTSYAGKAKASASWQVDSETGIATVPMTTETVAGIARKATDNEAAAGENSPIFVNPFQLQTYGVPSGAIIMWSGSTDAIPTGWALCDGENGTPNLCDRFILGAGNTYIVGDTGGSTSTGETTLTVDQMPSHKHTDGYSSENKQGLTEPSYGRNPSVSSAGVPTIYNVSQHKASNPYTSTEGSSQPHSHAQNLPPYCVLAYIMKL